MQDDLVPIIQKLNDSPENTSKIISEKLSQILGSQHDNNKINLLPRCNATVVWEKARNIGRKDKLNRFENMDRYYKSSHQNSKHLRQDKQYLKENNLIDSQENQIVVLDDIPIEQKSVQSETSLNENPILSKFHRVGKKAHDQMCLLISNNWWYSWAYKKTKKIINNVVIDLKTI
ncbi:hypothetical protein GLOIN_2v1791791 [Rhizophagus irregularis DAOM 181602=DAOM 197198]|uniref:Uncharacterized protein n=1 Tax=Rhizophagus irregularis (strain DAOM 181602 / DAOM 197198 / MUCL 43194) TaxID=747089 RepID=A0A2P4NU11_RHIID|nr:hypothetical protein GLOIN_2v1791791 [Rhizophagus irregularis DAOM 181602=DAOM 197198]POG56635.1 hypothetical protein GLOIN_2v1791791 [Rhizophagus irregularis DAOM 181602=DAOM 197198]|eukprot:XP_025164359.1 hypothetical protein GLOIN_2v1791791 [Rhizophagus irregularis DAOM 181602=DAOM 197198]